MNSSFVSYAVVKISVSKKKEKMNFERKKKLLTAKIFEMEKKNLNQGKHLMKLSSGA